MNRIALVIRSCLQIINSTGSFIISKQINFCSVFERIVFDRYRILTVNLKWIVVLVLICLIQTTDTKTDITNLRIISHILCWLFQPWIYVRCDHICNNYCISGNFSGCSQLQNITKHCSLFYRHTRRIKNSSFYNQISGGIDGSAGIIILICSQHIPIYHYRCTVRHRKCVSTGINITIYMCLRCFLELNAFIVGF